jgi:hypothetical protein
MGYVYGRKPEHPVYPFCPRRRDENLIRLHTIFYKGLFAERTRISA